MPSFGTTSRQRLSTCHPDIQYVLHNAIQHYDFSVIEGIRTAEKQNEYFKKGLSTLDGYEKLSWHQDRFGDGLSRAVDIAPYVNGDILWDDNKEWKKLIRIIIQEAQIALEDGAISHRFEFGYFWVTFSDDPHIQIKEI